MGPGAGFNMNVSLMLELSYLMKSAPGECTKQYVIDRVHYAEPAATNYPQLIKLQTFIENYRKGEHGEWTLDPVNYQNGSAFWYGTAQKVLTIESHLETDGGKITGKGPVMVLRMGN